MFLTLNLFTAADKPINDDYIGFFKVLENMTQKLAADFRMFGQRIRKLATQYGWSAGHLEREFLKDKLFLVRFRNCLAVTFAVFKICKLMAYRWFICGAVPAKPR